MVPEKGNVDRNLYARGSEGIHWCSDVRWARLYNGILLDRGLRDVRMLFFDLTDTGQGGRKSPTANW